MLEIILKNREDCLLKSYRDKHATCKGIRPTGHIMRLLVVPSSGIIMLQTSDFEDWKLS